MAKKLHRKFKRLDVRRKHWDLTKGVGACPKHTHKKPGSMKK